MSNELLVSFLSEIPHRLLSRIQERRQKKGPPIYEVATYLAIDSGKMFIVTRHFDIRGDEFSWDVYLPASGEPDATSQETVDAALVYLSSHIMQKEGDGMRKEREDLHRSLRELGFDVVLVDGSLKWSGNVGPLASVWLPWVQGKNVFNFEGMPLGTARTWTHALKIVCERCDSTGARIKATPESSSEKSSRAIEQEALFRELRALNIPGVYLAPEGVVLWDRGWYVWRSTSGNVLGPKDTRPIGKASTPAEAAKMVLASIAVVGEP